MGLLGKLLSIFSGGATPAPVTPATRAVPPVLPRPGGVTVAVMGPSGNYSNIQISDAEVAGRAQAYAFVLTTDPPALRTGDQWWEENTHKRRVREGSDKAYAWLRPFVPLGIAKLEPLRKAQDWGPHGANAVAKELRALIRAKRKAREPHGDLLYALYGACIVVDLAASLEFEGRQPHAMTQFVDINELQEVRCDYLTIGYQCIGSLAKTDVKWLVDAFGEPAEHQSFDSLWPHVRRNAISRYCWSDLRRSSKRANVPEQAQQAMQEWLNKLVTRNLGYHKEWEQRVAARKVQLSEQASSVDDSRAATKQPFVVADLETTGLNAATDELLEFAALKVDPSGTVTAEFSVLVRVARPVPDVITKLTGISQADVDREGQPLADAMRTFLAFVESRPVFFHNAPFDQGFLKSAGAQARLKFGNPVHDTLVMARAAWPSLGTYKLAALAGHVGAPAPTHRGLADARATLAVLLAARNSTPPW